MNAVLKDDDPQGLDELLPIKNPMSMEELREEFSKEIKLEEGVVYQPDFLRHIDQINQSIRRRWQ